MQFSDKPLLYNEYRTPSLHIYRKLYRRTTDIQNGLIMFSFGAEKLKSQLQSLLEYPEQQVFLINSENQLVWPSSDDIAKESLFALSEQISSLSGNNVDETLTRDFAYYTAT